MHQKKAIAIGAGASRLASTRRLQAQGLSVIRPKRNAMAGGPTGLFAQSGFRPGPEPTIVMMPEAHRDAFRAAGRTPSHV